MHSIAEPEIMWGLGLDPETAVLVEQAAGPGYLLRNISPEAFGWMRGVEEAPRVAWIPWASWRALSRAKQREAKSDGTLRRVLLLAESDPEMEPEQAFEQGFITALRAPHSRFALRDTVLRLRELGALTTDLRRKTDEIALERELLTRKTNHLGFLNRIISRASASLDTATILTKARTDLASLLPLTSLSAVFWAREPDAPGLLADIYMNSLAAPPESDIWTETLLDAARKLGGAPVSEVRQHTLTPSRHLRQVPSPQAGRLLMLPLSSGGETFGCLALSTSESLRLGKDQVQTLNAAVNHLALALRNAHLFRQVKSLAERDGLTRIANRRSFEERLESEAVRHARYNQPLALIMVDVDHFKRVNDTCGHQAGDAVLREVASLLCDSLRSTDFPARYGGEEFAIVLPHTPREHAVLLAERIRERVAERCFLRGEVLPVVQEGCKDGDGLKLTVSLGVAALEPGLVGSDLVALADQALYLAKNGGRDCVMVAQASEAGYAGASRGLSARERSAALLDEQSEDSDSPLAVAVGAGVCHVGAIR